ncbi:MAG: response regulator [Desulfobacteraceae bacterium]
MTRIRSLSRLWRPADDHGNHNLHSGASKSPCSQNGMQPVKGKRRNPKPKNRHVMLVQRQSIELQAMAEMLSVLGYRVIPIEDSAAALLYFGREPCEMVISELGMPQVNGFELAQWIRRRSPQTHILIMTACCQAEVAPYMESQVVDGWLFKPFGLVTLNHMLQSVKNPEPKVVRADHSAQSV